MKQNRKSKAANDISVTAQVHFTELFKGAIREFAVLVAVSCIASFMLEIALIFALVLGFCTWVLWGVYRYQEIKHKEVKRRLSSMTLKYERDLTKLSNHAANEVRLKNEEIEKLRHKVTSKQKEVTLAGQEVTQWQEKVTQLNEEVTQERKKVTYAEMKKEEVEFKVTQLEKEVTLLTNEVTRQTDRANRVSAQVTQQVTQKTKEYEEQLNSLRLALDNKNKEYLELQKSSRVWELGYIAKELGRLRKGKNNEEQIAQLEKRKAELEQDQLKVVA
jgi:chromosome segregation ATPase